MTPALQIRPLSPGFGAEASGVDVSRLSNDEVREIERAFFAAQVLVLRAQQLTAADFHAFARRFGPPEPHVIDQFHHPEHADILILSNVIREGKFRWNLLEGAKGVQLAELGLKSWKQRKWLEVPKLKP